MASDPEVQIQKRDNFKFRGSFGAPFAHGSEWRAPAISGVSTSVVGKDPAAVALEPTICVKALHAANKNFHGP